MLARRLPKRAVWPDGKVHSEHHGQQRRVFQGECESLTLPTADGQYGVQAGHSPVLVALEMGIMQFTVNGETRNVLVGDGIAEVTPSYVVLLVDSASARRISIRTVPRPPASAPRNACSTSRACTSITRARLP